MGFENINDLQFFSTSYTHNVFFECNGTIYDIEGDETIYPNVPQNAVMFKNHKDAENYFMHKFGRKPRYNKDMRKIVCE